MGTTIGPAIDRLIDLFANGFNGTAIDGSKLYGPNGQPALPVGPLTEVNPDVIIGDTRPVDSDGNFRSGAVYAIVGRESEESESDINATAQYQVLGRQRIQEAYTLPGHVLVIGQGPQQKPTRDAAFALHDRIVKLIWSDPTLGGVLQDGRIALVAGFTLSQPDPGTSEQFSSGGAVSAQVSFSLAVENSYVP